MRTVHPHAIGRGWGIAVGLLLLAGDADADQDREGFLLDRYRPPVSVEDGVSRVLPSTLGSLQPSALLVVEHSHTPLILVRGDEDDFDEVGATIKSQVAAHIVAALGLGERYELFVAVPLVLGQSGDRPGVGGARFGSWTRPVAADPSVGFGISLFGERDRGLQLGGLATIGIPVGSTDDLASDGGLSGRVQALSAVIVGPVMASLNLGFAYRPERDWDTVKIGSEVLADAGLYVRIAPGLRLTAELVGATAIRSGQFLSRFGTTAEALFGFHYLHASGISFAAGVGPGLTQAPGVPELRGLAVVGFEIPTASRQSSPPPREPALDQEPIDQEPINQGAADELVPAEPETSAPESPSSAPAAEPPPATGETTPPPEGGQAPSPAGPGQGTP